MLKVSQVSNDDNGEGNGMHSVISVFDAASLTSSLSPLTLSDSEGEGTRLVVSVVDAASSTSEVSDIIAIDGSLGGRASPCLPPSRRRCHHRQRGGGGEGFTYCCWSSGCFVAFVLDRAVLGETKLCQKWTQKNVSKIKKMSGCRY